MATKQKSRTARWSEAVNAALAIANEIEDAKARLGDALAEVVSIQEEFQEWRDNLPESLQQSALGEKLEAVSDMDFDVLDNIDVDSVLEVLNEADGADLPLGFGRD